jgi:hypothetical protein
VSEGAKRLSGFFTGIKGTNLGCFTQRIRNLPYRATWRYYPANNFDGLVGGGGDVTGVNQFSYTADFGGGVSATISAQDQVAYLQTNNFNTSNATAATIVGGIYGSNSVGGAWAPDFVGKVVVDQAWGLAQLSVAAHDNHASYYGPTATLTETAGHPGDKWGFAVQGALPPSNTITPWEGKRASLPICPTCLRSPCRASGSRPRPQAAKRGRGTHPP